MTTSVPAASNPGPPFRLANVLSAACLLFAIALPTISLYMSFTQVGTLIEGLHLPKPVNQASLSLFQRIAAALIDTSSPLLQAYGLLCARRCFESFARGDFFTPQVVKGLRGLASGLFFAIVASLVVTPLLSLLLTMNAPPGGHVVSAGVNSDQLHKLLFVGIFWQIAAVMTRAVNLAEENSQFV